MEVNLKEVVHGVMDRSGWLIREFRAVFAGEFAVKIVQSQR